MLNVLEADVQNTKAEIAAVNVVAHKFSRRISELSADEQTPPPAAVIPSGGLLEQIQKTSESAMQLLRDNDEEYAVDASAVTKQLVDMVLLLQTVAALGAGTQPPQAAPSTPTVFAPSTPPIRFGGPQSGLENEMPQLPLAPASLVCSVRSCGKENEVTPPASPETQPCEATDGAVVASETQPWASPQRKYRRAGLLSLSADLRSAAAPSSPTVFAMEVVGQCLGDKRKIDDAISDNVDAVAVEPESSQQAQDRHTAKVFRDELAVCRTRSTSARANPY